MRCCACRSDFTIHRKLERVREKRMHMFDNPDERTVDWSAAEDLALASILADGISIRLTGEDVERGTFSHRHAVLHDANDGKLHVPLQSLPQARAAFEIHNSPLTENALVGFEYGYNIQEPSRLVIWEAQYGDFINGAQTMIDEFIVSARGKWGLRPSLVFLLPHAHEGQGPDHASARPERFLQLAADINMRIANCTTAAQYFHLLRRQAALLARRPAAARRADAEEPAAASARRVDAARARRRSLQDGAARRGRFGDEPADIRRVLVCSGKVYADLMASEHRAARRRRSPFAGSSSSIRCRCGICARCSTRIPNADEIVWVQEEPENMGAWDFIRPHLAEVSNGRTVRRVARPRSASPAEGSAARHALNQQALVNQAFADRAARAPDRRARPIARQGAGRTTVDIELSSKGIRQMPANIVVPEVGESIVDARVAKWLRREGEIVAVGDPLVELETDKIDLEVSAPQGGVLEAHRSQGRRGRQGWRGARRHRGRVGRRRARAPRAGRFGSCEAAPRTASQRRRRDRRRRRARLRRSTTSI